MSGYQSIYNSDNEYRTKIVFDILDKEGLNPVMIKKQDSSYNNFGGFEISVRSDDVLKAMKIISDEIDFN